MSCALLVLLGTAAEIKTARAAANPYSFYGSIGECASAERGRCDACVATGTCPAITDLGDGLAECTQLAADDGRGFALMCVNLALAIDAVASCTARRAPSCPRDTHASESISSLDANAGFLTDPACAAPLDGCLARLYGAPIGGPSQPPRDPTVGCDASCSGNPNCDADPGCEVYGSDDGCSDSGESSGCDDGGGDAGGADSCSGDSEDSCGSADNSGCDDSDCGGGGDSDCGSSSGGGGDCDSSGGGGDCGGGGGGGDCGGGGGGGDCGGGGGGGDCNVAGKRGRAGASLPLAVAWALLPLPFAILVRRRAERRRARAAWDEDSARAGGEVAP